MARFYGEVGYVKREEIRSGTWMETIIRKKNYYGDIIRTHAAWQVSDKVNDDVNISNQISIVGDDFAFSNFHIMRYIVFKGVAWKITNVEIQKPRLILTIGGV